MACSITIGEILTVIIALAAFYVAYRVAKTQIALNEKLLIAENLVAVDAVIADSIEQKDNITTVYSEVQIYNISKSILYLTEYTYNGTRYPNINSILPLNPARFYWIAIPVVIDGRTDIPHVHIVLTLSDINNVKHYCEISIDYVNSKWLQKVERCTKCE